MSVFGAKLSNPISSSKVHQMLMLNQFGSSRMSRDKFSALFGVLLLLLVQTTRLTHAEKALADNRELLEYLMQASSHAFSQLPPGYLYNSATEENQLELPVTSASASNLSGVVGDENENSTMIGSNYPNISYLNHQLNGQSNSHPGHLTSTVSPINHASQRTVNLTRLNDEDDAANYLINMSNKQAKSSDFSGGSPLSYLHSHLPVHHAASKLYRMTGGREGAWGRREPLSARTVSSLFGLPSRPNRKAFATGELKSIDLMKSAADIPTASASYYTNADGELEDPAQITASLAKSAAAMRSFPLYHQASTYGQYYTAAEDPRQAYYQQMRDYYGDPHSHDMAYSKSDFYWLIPIAFLIGRLLNFLISLFNADCKSNDFGFKLYLEF